MRVLIALGGNALLQRGERPDARIQREHIDAAVAALAPVLAAHQVVITHGNGPQVGILAAESAADPRLSEPYPLDVLGALTQGMIGYWLVQSIGNVLPGREVVAVIDQTLVDVDDPRLATPTKFVGEVVSEAQARELERVRGWTMRPDGPHWRRVVGSPAPLSVVESAVVRRLVEDGTVVVCAGGGGVPVVRDRDGRLSGVEAVVDKDLTAALLATELGADALVVLTDVPGVMREFGSPDAQVIPRVTAAELRAMEVPDGSMRPKVEAVCRFVEATGRIAVIGSLTDAAALLTGDAGTTVLPDGMPSRG